MDALAYTRSELEKELVLLEKHLKQYKYAKRDFCLDCALKHWTAIEGLSEEGVGFTNSPGERKLFESMAMWAKEWRENLPRTDEAFVIAYQETRVFRKDVVLSPLLSKIEPILAATGTKDYNLHLGGELMQKWERPHNPIAIEKPISFLGSRKGERHMSLTPEKIGVSLGYGALDVGFMAIDEWRTLTKSFRNVSDWTRLFTFVGSTILSLSKPKGISDRVLEDIEVLCYSSGPKLEESFYDLAKTEGQTVAAKLKAAFEKVPAPTTPTTPTQPAALQGRQIAPQLR